MATIEDAIRAGALVEYALPEHELRLPRRRLLAANEFFDWLDETPELHKQKVGGRTLHEHAEGMLCSLRCERKPSGGDLKRMMPTKAGVWHAYPPKLRFYGWLTAASEFVAVAGALEVETKTNMRLNDRKRDEVLTFAKRHRLTATMKEGDISAFFTS